VLDATVSDAGTGLPGAAHPYGRRRPYSCLSVGADPSPIRPFRLWHDAPRLVPDEPCPPEESGKESDAARSSRLPAR